MTLTSLVAATAAAHCTATREQYFRSEISPAANSAVLTAGLITAPLMGPMQ
eukprot:CAMPEP_0119401326 /NCGR_PEP_ID=MMETSP1334-20130426/142315_1 /TAXON_ID=127549 /ORGANISM="Calcidiscus leptoporus, Strain RCC1130" /LENGTH=50 /DNA_ID=CAMNT_0007425241 /DNA_START=352 /DNA_END=504 /DNA_ORIENTATION=+